MHHMLVIQEALRKSVFFEHLDTAGVQRSFLYHVPKMSSVRLRWLSQMHNLLTPPLGEAQVIFALPSSS